MENVRARYGWMWACAVVLAACGTSTPTGGGGSGGTDGGIVDGGGGTDDGGTDGGTADGGGGTDDGGTDGGTIDGGGESDGGGGGATTYTLHVDLTGTGAVDVSGSVAQRCTTACNLTVPAHGTVSLAASPASGYAFSGWSGACTGTGTCTLSDFAADQTVGATFVSSGPTKHVVLQIGGQGQGTVTSLPAGISCSSTCEADFPQNVTVTLTAAPTAGSQFAYWAGHCDQISGTTCTFAANTTRTIYAAFEPPPPVRYTVRQIPNSHAADGGVGGSSIPLAIDSAGNAVGWTINPVFTGDEHGFRYDAATNTSQVLPPADHGSQAWGISDSGSIATTVLTDTTSGRLAARAHRLDNRTTLVDLGTLGGNTWAFGINASNQVVGWFVRTDGERTYTRAFLHDGTRMIDLGSLDGTCSEAHAINAAGDVVGSSCASSGHHAVLFRGGTTQDLGTLSTAQSAFSNAEGISNAGFIVGQASVDGPSGTDGFVRPPGGSMQDVGTTFGASCSNLLGVNDAGAAVGTTCFPGHDPFSHAGTEYRAVVWLNGRLWDLAYLAGDPSLSITDATAINGAGQIVARGHTPSWSGGLLLTPQ